MPIYVWDGWQWHEQWWQCLPNDCDVVEPQHIPLYQELSNRENVEYISKLWEYACREIATTICENIDTLLKGLQSCKSEK